MFNHNKSELLNEKQKREENVSRSSVSKKQNSFNIKSSCNDSSSSTSKLYRQESKTHEKTLQKEVNSANKKETERNGINSKYNESKFKKSKPYKIKTEKAEPSQTRALKYNSNTAETKSNNVNPNKSPEANLEPFDSELSLTSDTILQTQTENISKHNKIETEPNGINYKYNEKIFKKYKVDTIKHKKAESSQTQTLKCNSNTTETKSNDVDPNEANFYQSSTYLDVNPELSENNSPQANPEHFDSDISFTSDTILQTQTENISKHNKNETEPNGINYKYNESKLKKSKPYKIKSEKAESSQTRALIYNSNTTETKSNNVNPNKSPEANLEPFDSELSLTSDTILQTQRENTSNHNKNETEPNGINYKYNESKLKKPKPYKIKSEKAESSQTRGLIYNSNTTETKSYYGNPNKSPEANLEPFDSDFSLTSDTILQTQTENISKHNKNETEPNGINYKYNEKIFKKYKVDTIKHKKAESSQTQTLKCNSNTKETKSNDVDPNEANFYQSSTYLDVNPELSENNSPQANPEHFDSDISFTSDTILQTQTENISKHNKNETEPNGINYKYNEKIFKKYKVDTIKDKKAESSQTQALKCNSNTTETKSNDVDANEANFYQSSTYLDVNPELSENNSPQANLEHFDSDISFTSDTILQSQTENTNMHHDTATEAFPEESSSTKRNIGINNTFTIYATDSEARFPLSDSMYSSDAKRTLDLSYTSNQLHSTAIDNSLKSKTFTNLSSTIADSSTSAYIPELSASISKDNLGNSNCLTDQDESVKIVDAPINVNKITIPYSKSKAKKHFCVFCKQLQSKIGRHLLLKHKKEAEVRKAIALPKRSKERMKILDQLRKQGDFEHNTSSDHNTGILIVSRQQQSKCKNNADDYECCKKCKGFFSRRTLRVHVATCNYTMKNKRRNFVASRTLTQYLHPIANKTIKTKIFPVLRNDVVTKSIRYDELIIKFGNKLSEKYSLQHQHDMIRANLRLLGRFLIEIKKLDANIVELKDIFKPYMFDKCVAALRTVANWDDVKMRFNNPAVAQNITCLIKKCGKKQRAEFIKYDCEDLKRELENFLLLWEEEIPTLINKKALEDQTNQKRVKKVVLPSKEDIKKLYTYLKEKIVNAMESLSQSFSISSWIELTKATLIFIQIFNRRRPGEIERLTIDNFNNKEVITDNIDKCTLNTFSKESLKFAKQFVRISLRGKLGRTVSVLLCPMSIKATQLIMKFRIDAGISPKNNYIFARENTSVLSKPYYRACQLLKVYSQECGAQLPESLRGTTLRKHIATYTSMLNIEEASVDRLANFMGHHKEIHKGIYRMSVPVAEITCISKLLMAAVGDEVEDGNVEDEEEDEDGEDKEDNEIEDVDEEENNSLLQKSKNSSSTSRKRSKSPLGKTRRCRWNNAERKAIYSIFGKLECLEKLPSLQQCSDAIDEMPVLNGRTPQQIKSWIDNQRRYKIGKNCPVVESIHSCEELPQDNSKPYPECCPQYNC